VRCWAASTERIRSWGLVMSAARRIGVCEFAAKDWPRKAQPSPASSIAANPPQPIVARAFSSRRLGTKHLAGCVGLSASASSRANLPGVWFPPERATPSSITSRNVPAVASKPVSLWRRSASGRDGRRNGAGRGASTQSRADCGPALRSGGPDFMLIVTGGAGFIGSNWCMS